jgi:hypothetical protein
MAAKQRKAAGFTAAGKLLPAIFAERVLKKVRTLISNLLAGYAVYILPPQYIVDVILKR